METATAESLAERFRDVMAGVCTPVSVVTAMEGDRPHGTTVSAFASLSMTPPMVLVALDHGSELLTMVTATGRFGVNILGSDQAEVAVRFAGKGRGKFDGVSWWTSAELPRLCGVPGWLACTVDNMVTGGDHMIALGEVVAADRKQAAPLTYHARSFGTHTTEGKDAP